MWNKYIQGENGQVPPPKCERVDDRIQGVVMDYENRTAIEYLRGIVHNF